eukprot:scaffold16443_cov106-Isochrysis_galbana.AAC.3
MKRKPRDVAACCPQLEWKDRHALVVEELRHRAAVALGKRASDETLRAAREEGRALAAGGSTISSTSSTTQEAAARMFKLVTVDDVKLAWAKAIIKKALPLDILDEPLFRQAIEITAKCDSKMIVDQRQRSILRATSL